jgi:hypothetical protein
MTHSSRSGIARATQFLELAQLCPPDARVDFEAFLEASIVFARSAIHRFQTQYEGHQNWKAWWDSLRGNAAVEFFRTERNWILKEASPKIGQKIFAASIGPGGAHTPGYQPSKASEFYYFENSEVAATDTVEQHLGELESLLTDAEALFV